METSIDNKLASEIHLVTDDSVFVAERSGLFKLHYVVFALIMTFVYVYLYFSDSALIDFFSISFLSVYVFSAWPFFLKYKLKIKGIKLSGYAYGIELEIPLSQIEKIEVYRYLFAPWSDIVIYQKNWQSSIREWGVLNADRVADEIMKRLPEPVPVINRTLPFPLLHPIWWALYALLIGCM